MFTQRDLRRWCPLRSARDAYLQLTSDPFQHPPIAMDKRAAEPHPPNVSAKGSSFVEVTDPKFAVDLATHQSYSENVFLFIPNIIGASGRSWEARRGC
jgi:hypothetical protein